MSRYTHGPGSSFSAAVGAGEAPGQRLAVVDAPGLGRSAPSSLGGQRSGPQSRRSRAPPQRVRRKAQPDIEGIETPAEPAVLSHVLHQVAKLSPISRA